MVERYLNVLEILQDSIFTSDRSFAVLPSSADNIEIRSLFEDLQKHNSITVSLQDETIDMSDVRNMFGKCIETYPIMGKYLSSTAAIINYPLAGIRVSNC